MKTALILLAAVPALATAQANLRTAPSGRATAQVSLAPPTPEGQQGPPPMLVTIDYGQPHARGRSVAGALEADLGKVWRLGANNPTTLTTDVDLVLGGTTVPNGKYMLLAETTPGAWKLIVNKKSEGEYDPAWDLARIPLKSRTLASPLESLTIWLIPGAAGTPGGELRIAWGTLEHMIPWSIKQ